MSAIDIYPVSVGSLSDPEKADFSLPFRNDWDYVHAANLGVNADGILLPAPALETATFGLPDSYRQFFPAIQLAVAHERDARQQLVLDRAVLTIRQWFVRRNNSQQNQDRIHEAHQDGDGRTPERFYTVADTASTQYFPSLVPHKGNRGSVRVGKHEPLVEFRPYDVIHASAQTYHRSPPMPRDGRRTFMRLSFKYNPSQHFPTIGSTMRS